jgi:hypothetical protein
VCLNIATPNPPIAVILFLAFNSDFSIILNVLLYTLFHLLMHTRTSPVPVRLTVLKLCISLFILKINFCEWTHFPFLSAIFAHFSSMNSLWKSSLQPLIYYYYFCCCCFCCCCCYGAVKVLPELQFTLIRLTISQCLCQQRWDIETK